MRILTCILLALCLGAAAKAQTPINVTFDFEIDAAKPDSVFNPAVKTFYVVWEDAFGDIRGRTVGTKGQLGPIQKIFEARKLANLRFEARFEDASVVFQEAENGAGSYFVVARLTQSQIRGPSREFVEIVGRRLDGDGKPVSGILRLSQTGLGARQPLPASFLAGKPDIAAPAMAAEGSPLVVWSEADTIRAAYWPGAGPSRPFPLIRAKGGAAIPSPSVAYDPNRGRGRFATAFAFDTRRVGDEIAVAETPVGSTSPASVKVVAQAASRAAGSFGPILRNDVDIAVGAKTIDVVFWDAGTSWGRSLAPDFSTREKVRSLPRIAAGHTSFEFPTTTAYGEGFASGYDSNAFGGNFAGLSLARTDGRWVAGFGVPRPAILPRFGSKFVRPTVAAFEDGGIVAFVWSNENPPAQRIEKDVWAVMMTPPKP